MSSVRFSSLLIVGFSLACGGSTPTSPGHAEHGEHGQAARHTEGGHAEGEHPDMPPALHAFHEAFAAHWHGDRSGAAVCPDAANLFTLAQAAAQENGDAETIALTQTRATTVVERCDAEDHGEAFDTAFSELHHSLHDLMGVPVPAE